MLSNRCPGDNRLQRASAVWAALAGAALLDLGWVDGQNIAFEQRHADQKFEHLPSLAAELVTVRPDVILAVGSPAARAAKSATQTVPIVFARIGDPIGIGLVPELARPGGRSHGCLLAGGASLRAARAGERRLGGSP